MNNTSYSIIKYGKLTTIYILSLFYIVVGIKHFTDTDFFIMLIPDFFPLHYEIVLISGFFEIILGLLILINKTRRIASWGLIILLICVFPSNIYLYLSDHVREILEISKKQALLRMPFQIPLIIIAYWHSKENSKEWFSYLCLLIFIPTILYFINL